MAGIEDSRKSSGKSGPKDQVALHYYYTSPSHWCTTHGPLLPLRKSHIIPGFQQTTYRKREKDIALLEKVVRVVLRIG